MRRRLDWRGGGCGQLRIAEGCRKLEVPRRLSAGWNCAKGLLLSTGGGGLEYEAELCKRWIVVMQVHTFSNRPSEVPPWAWECAGGGLDPGICARHNVQWVALLAAHGNGVKHRRASGCQGVLGTDLIRQQRRNDLREDVTFSRCLSVNCSSVRDR